MALGILLVGSRFAGIPDLTTDGVDGLLVTHGDTRACARDRTAADEPGLAVWLAAAARRKVLECSPDRTPARTETVYRDAIAERVARTAR
jgi:hypothetical protein